MRYPEVCIVSRREQSFVGSLLGLAVGDVLGCPLEGMHPDTIADTFGVVDDLVVLPEEKIVDWYFWRLPGAHSDDTQQALTIAGVLAEKGRLDTDEVMARWRQMAEVSAAPAAANGDKRRAKFRTFGCHRGTGAGFRQRVRTPGVIKPNWGNGAAMRVAPVGLLCAGDSSRLIRTAVENALMTHGHPHAVAASIAVASTVGCMIEAPQKGAEEVLQHVICESNQGEQLVREEYLSSIHETARGAIGEFSQMLHSLSDWLTMPLPEALATIGARGRSVLPLPADAPVFATQSASLMSVPTALLVALRNLDDFPASIVESINLGGDTDTIGAIVGAILGARLGKTSIPASWVQSVLAHQQIEARGVYLATGQRPADFVDQLTFESEISRREMETRQRLRSR
jgi:ADP-ribosyl-[dinitrogen reductase] hydrolase